VDDFDKLIAEMKAKYAERSSEQIAIDEARDAEVERERVRTVEAKRRAALDALTPSAHRWARADAPELQDRVGLSGARHWAMHPPASTFVLLTGDAGSGKTSLACAAMRTAIVEHRARLSGCLFVSAHRLGVARIQAKAGTGEPEVVERAMSCDWLLLDDLGSERDTANNAIPDVVFERYDRDAVTWITTGLHSDQIEKRYGSGFLRRLLDRSALVKLSPKTAQAALPGAQ
jgi:DNA replication protein DnaC